MRFRAFRSGDGYRIVLQSDDELSGRLKLRAVGETGQFTVDVTEAFDEVENKQLEVKPSMIDDVSLDAGVKKTLRVKIDADSDLVLAMGG